MKASLFIFRVCALSLVLIYCEKSPEPAEESSPPAEKTTEVKDVYSEKVTVKELSDASRYMGRVFSIRDFSVPTEVKGVLVEKVVLQGMPVKKNQIIARVKPLLKGFAVNNHIIKSPINGILGLWLQDEGAIINENEAVARIYDPKSLKTRIHITESDRNFILNNKYRLEADLTLSQKTIPITLKVLSVGAIMDSKTLTYPADISIEADPNHDLTLGSWITVIVKSNFKKALMISKESVKDIDNVKKVALIEKDNTVKWVTVVPGEYKSNSVEVVSGLQENDTIITRYTKRPKDGELVKAVLPQNTQTPSDIKI